MNDNTAKKIVPFQYSDSRQFEKDIRADERQKVYNEIKRKHKVATKAKKRKILARYIIQKMIGIAIIAVSVAIVKSGITYDIDTGYYDGIFLLITILRRLYMIFTKELFKIKPRQNKTKMEKLNQKKLDNIFAEWRIF